MHVETGDNFGSHSPGTIHLVFGDSVFYQLGASQFIWVASDVQGSTCPHFHSARVTSTCHHV